MTEVCRLSCLSLLLLSCIFWRICCWKNDVYKWERTDRSKGSVFPQNGGHIAQLKVRTLHAISLTTWRWSTIWVQDSFGFTSKKRQISFLIYTEDPVGVHHTKKRCHSGQSANIRWLYFNFFFFTFMIYHADVGPCKACLKRRAAAVGVRVSPSFSLVSESRCMRTLRVWAPSLPSTAPNAYVVGSLAPPRGCIHEKYVSKLF